MDPESLEREARGKESGPRTVLVVGRWLILVLPQSSFLRKEMEVMQEKLLRWKGLESREQAECDLGNSSRDRKEEGDIK